ncbi:unnamed protein product [Acanthoscelides obtectus]|uniref:Uncharacterized protein n=2 Tax=Acanthoscelides obtectus TaxID=200917 RepID=A0A9P0LKH7_ACAOB|nr:unnamed protein product [Acanthoscelides obtectus]CAK1626056.1 hypothetical protein AOBTE_LOCUS3570 [Acanthoscelides obtectus]
MQSVLIFGKADLQFMTLKETTRRSRSSCQLLTAGQARDRHSRKLNIQKWKKLCTCDPKRHFLMRQLLLLVTGTFNHAICF